MRVLLSQGLSRRDQRLRDMARALPRAETLLDGPRQRLDRAGEKLEPALIAGVQRRRVRLADVSGSLRPATLRQRLAQDRARKADAFAALVARLSDAGQRQTRGWRQRIDALDRLRETLSYKATLARGYAVVRGDGAVVTGKAAAGKATSLEIEFADGRITVGAGSAKPASRKAGKPPEQGSLF